MMGDEMAESVQADMLPIGVLEGVPIYPIFGAEPKKKFDPDDENTPPGEDDDEDDTEDEDDEDEPDDEDDDEDDEDDKSKKKSKKKSKESDEEDDEESDDDRVEFWKNKSDSYKRRMEAADARATKAERENRRLSQSKEDALDGPGKAELQDAKDEAKKAVAQVNTLRLQNALLSDNQFEWHDPADVIKALSDDDTVEIDEETGRVLGVKKALARLARQKPYLVKKSATSRTRQAEDDDEDDEPQTRRRPSGSQSGTRRNTAKSKATERAKIVGKYPILARR